MKTIFDATTAPSEHLRLVAMECLVNIAHLYYDKLKDYMQVIYEVCDFCNFIFASIMIVF